MNIEKTKEEIIELIPHVIQQTACELAMKEIKEFQQISQEPFGKVKEKNEFEVYKSFANFKFALMARNEEMRGNTDGVVVAQITQNILATHCDKRDVLEIKELIPVWSEASNDFGWITNYY